ncbi:MAG: hypothetical protein R3C56_28470 [Pirellulaceae bacterium]
MSNCVAYGRLPTRYKRAPSPGIYGKASQRWGSVAAAEHGCLLTDSPQVAEQAEQLGCPQITLIASIDQPVNPASLRWPSARRNRGLGSRPRRGLLAVCGDGTLATAAAELASGPPAWSGFIAESCAHPWDAPLDMRTV